MVQFSDQPRQRLDREAYLSSDWFNREQQTVFANTWQFACMRFDLVEPGDFRTITIAGHPIFVLKAPDGTLSAWHNLCRHRGTELLQGSGNTGKTIVCPYHRWTYGLDGQLRGLPELQTCFPDFDRAAHNLKPVGLGCFKDMVFVNLGDPEASTFDAWIGPLRGHEWPHEIQAANLKPSQPFVYEMDCNWKVFCENALDGYHLAYLHEKTLGGPTAALNVWEIHGQNLAWYSTERDGIKNRIPKFVEDHAGKGTTTIPGADVPGYGGVYFLFPATLVTPSPWSLTLSSIQPVSPHTTRMVTRTWVPDSWFGYKESPDQAPGYDPQTQTIHSKFWKQHPLETGDFQTEDIWVCEKMQRSLMSPAYQVGQLSTGSGGEAAIEFFQRTLLTYLGGDHE